MSTEQSVRQQMDQDIREALTGADIASIDKQLLKLGWRVDPQSMFAFDEQSQSFKGQLRLRPIPSTLADRYGAVGANEAISACQQFLCGLAKGAYERVGRREGAMRVLTEKDLWG